MRFHEVIIRPPGHVHASAFAEMAELVRAGLEALGYRVTFSENRWETGAVNIIFGAHHLIDVDGQWKVIPPARTILYHLEPLVDRAPWTSLALATAFATFPVWDYSAVNEAYRRNHHWPGTWYTVPVGYMPEWTRIISQDPPDIDVLFYGSLSPRRRKILDALIIAGVRVQVLFGVYGVERDAWIGRSRIVLNLHQVANYPFESVRVGYLLANRRCVLSETGLNGDRDAFRWRDGIAWAEYAEMVETCQAWLASKARRAALAEDGWQILRHYPETDYLTEVLERMAANHQL